MDSPWGLYMGVYGILVHNSEQDNSGVVCACAYDLNVIDPFAVSDFINYSWLSLKINDKFPED